MSCSYVQTSDYCWCQLHEYWLPILPVSLVVFCTFLYGGANTRAFLNLHVRITLSLSGYSNCIILRKAFNVHNSAWFVNAWGYCRQHWFTHGVRDLSTHDTVLLNPPVPLPWVECLHGLPSVAMYKHRIIAGASCMSTDHLLYQLAWLFSVRFCMGSQY